MSVVLILPSQKPKPVNCPICYKTLCRKADLPRHLRTHDENKEALYVLVPSQTKCPLTGLLSSSECTHAPSLTVITRPSKSPTCRPTSGPIPATARRSALSLGVRLPRATQAASRVTASSYMDTNQKHTAPALAKLLGNLPLPHIPLLNL